MSFWSPDNLQQVTAGRWLSRPTPAETEPVPTGLSIDSRAITTGQVFCAIKGERFDGHDFAQQAIDKGAAMLLVHRENVASQITSATASVLFVDDTTKALARLAAAYRRTLSGKVIAVTGSAGKTTTKQLIHAVLSPYMPGQASPKSFNNHIGVPLTLLAAKPTDRYVICEVGTNAPGEIAALGRIVEPDIAIITHVGHAHIEKLGSLEDVAIEKAALLGSLHENGLGIVNGDIDELAPHLKLAPSLIIFGRGETCDLRLTQCEAHTNGTHFQVNSRVAFDIPLLGEHNAMNALAAIAIGRHMSLNDDQIARGLASASAPDMRLNNQQIGDGQQGITLINDAYNANPDSVLAALHVLTTFTGRKVALLGDMLELGQQSPDLHRMVGSKLTEMNIDMAVFIGRAMMFAAEATTKVWSPSKVHTIAQWDEQTAQQVTSLLQPGDVVLMKGSRGMGLERLVPTIEQRFIAEDKKTLRHGDDA